jgi:uncharacterized protein (TIGR00369 family)
MRELNPDYIKAVICLANNCPFFKLMSLTIRELDIGHCLLESAVDDKYRQAFGSVHGGVFASIIDTAAFWAAHCELEETCGITSVDLKINYLSAASNGKLISRGRVIKLGRTLGLGEAEITDEAGKILAYGTSTLMIIPGLGFAGNPELPPKFKS